MHVGDRDVFTDGFGESPCTKSSAHLFEKNRSTKVPVFHLKAIVFFKIILDKKCRNILMKQGLINFIAEIKAILKYFLIIKF